MKKKKTLRRLITLYPQRWKLWLGISLTLIISVVGVSFSYMIMQVIDAAVENDRQMFFRSFFVILALVFINVLFVFFRTRLFGRYTENGMVRLRELFAKKCADLSLESMQTSHSGDLLSKGTNDMSRVRQFTATTLHRLIEIPISALIALVVLFVLSWRLSLISLALIPVLIIVSSLLSIPIGPASKRVQKKLGHVNAVVTDYIKGIEVVKSHNLEETLNQKNKRYVDESVESGVELAKRRAILESFSMIFSLMPFLATFLIGGYFVIAGTMTVGALLAFINLLNFVTFPLSQLAIVMGEAKKDMASASRIFETIDIEDERQDGETFEFHKSNAVIDIQGLTFLYAGDDKTIIDDLSLTIHQGETVAFVGPSGGGKSTLAKLIMGFYETYDGSIKIGGHEMNDWSLSAMRQHIALVSQDTFLFPESVRENIKHGYESADDKQVIEAAKQANAHDFIEQLPEGYDSVLSELGSSLSGGQKQRLSIARAILKDAPILILDEATSALDTESEAMIQKALESVIEHKTTIIIAHRLTTIKDVDKICVVADGNIVETGSHETLLNANGVYAGLYESQIEKAGDLDEKTNL